MGKTDGLCDVCGKELGNALQRAKCADGVICVQCQLNFVNNYGKPIFSTKRFKVEEIKDLINNYTDMTKDSTMWRIWLEFAQKGVPAIHSAGLDIPEVQGTLLWENDSLKFSGANTNFTLKAERIFSIDIKKQEDFLGSSIGGAIAGAALFGTLGAVIGGRNKKITTIYLIVSYQSKSNDTKYIAFEMPNKEKAKGFVVAFDKYRKEHGGKETREVEL